MKYMLLLASDPADDPTQDYVPGSPEFAAMMQEWFAYTAALNEAGVPTAPVHTAEDVFDCPQVEARGMLMEIASLGTSSKVSNHPSPNCCFRQASSNSTTIKGSEASKSAGGCRAIVEGNR